MGAVREGGNDVEWVGKALTAVKTERVWNGERGSVGEALKTVWVVGWRCRQLLKPVTSSCREDKQKPTLRDFTGAAPAGGRRIFQYIIVHYSMLYIHIYIYI